MPKAMPHLLVLVVVLSLLAACSSSQSGDGDGSAASLATDGPATVDDTDGLVPVPPVVLITKTAADDPDRFESSRLIVEAWNTAGIEAELLPVDAAVLAERTFTGKDYDVYFVSYGPTTDRLDPENMMAV
ncbi:hypothetical protein DVS28_a3550 [Euzebya pacifica]|uniref:ABC transporter substrate-binding protein n=2 Tax=Euzebya pacifica TaxID=1608957 RepID=A0A346Y176_9ACTN|nr:hypothetical protein DVS28_a3550 [Euzebya pacifica]